MTIRLNNRFIAGNAQKTNSDWNAVSGYAQILNKPTNLAHTSGDETLSGIKTFSSSPIVPTISTSSSTEEVANALLVDNKISAHNNAPNTHQDIRNSISSLSDSFVTKTGNDVISGIKTYSGENVFNTTLTVTPIILKGGFSLGTTPSEDTSITIGVHDSVGDWMGGWETFYRQDGSFYKAISVRKQDKSNNYATLSIGYNSNQTEFVNASSGVKSSFVGWNIPNYTAIENISSGYQATSNGFIRAQAWLNGNTALGYIDNIEVYRWVDDGNSRGTSFIPIGKGSTWTCTGGFEILQFIPCIGG